MDTTPKFWVIRMGELRDDLGGHYVHRNRDLYDATCWCDARVGQDVSQCPNCNMQIIWEGSRVWTRMFGSAEKAKKRLTTFPPGDDDRAGLRLCRSSGVAGFPSESDRVTWNRARKKLGGRRMMGIVSWVLKQKNSRWGQVSHAVNIARKAYRDEVTKSKLTVQEPVRESRVVHTPDPTLRPPDEFLD